VSGEQPARSLRTKPTRETALPHILIALILKGEFPPEHKAQVQGQLWIAKREWVDLEIYWPSLPPFIKRAWRDETYIANLAAAITRFNEELEGIVAWVKAYGDDKRSA